MYYYQYDSQKSIAVPEPFKRYITPMFMGDDLELQGINFSVHITEWEPSGKVDLHIHKNATEAMYCIEGVGRTTINGEEYEFIPGSMIVAPPNVEHEIENTGKDLLRVLCIFSPPNTEKGLKERAIESVKEALIKKI